MTPYSFGEGTSLSYDDLLARQAYEKRLRAELSGSSPKNVGEGIHAIAKALVARGVNKQNEQEHARIKTEADQAMAGLGLGSSYDQIAAAAMNPMIMDNPGSRAIVSSLLNKQLNPKKGPAPAPNTSAFNSIFSGGAPAEPSAAPVVDELLAPPAAASDPVSELLPPRVSSRSVEHPQLAMASGTMSDASNDIRNPAVQMAGLEMGTGGSPIASGAPSQLPPGMTAVPTDGPFAIPQAPAAPQATSPLNQLIETHGEGPMGFLKARAWFESQLGSMSARDRAANLARFDQLQAAWPKEKVRQITGEEAAARGLDPKKVYNIKPDGSMSGIGGGDTIVNNTIDTGKDRDLTKTQNELDKQYTPDYLAWTVQGGSADAIKSMEQLEQALTALVALDADGNPIADAKRGANGANLSGPVLGLMPDAYLAAKNPEALNTRELIEEIVQRNLRLVLGAQFTEKEGERLIARAYNPKLEEHINAERVGRLMTAIKQAAAAQDSAAKYYQQNGTLVGWDGRLPTMAQMNEALSGLSLSEMSDEELLEELNK